MRRFLIGGGLSHGLVLLAVFGFLIAAEALGDVTISVVDATGTARQDESLDGIGQTIFSADVYVEVAADDAWFSGGVGLLETTREPGVRLYYTTDPNSGEPVFTAPGFSNDAEMLSTFVSYPLGQLQRGRFQRPAQLAGGYFGAASPNMTPDQLEVSYYEYPTLFEYGSGHTQRITIDIENSAYAGRSVYVAADGPAQAGDARLVEFESAATTRSGEQRIQRWAFYAVPEPASAWLIATPMVIALCLRRRERYQAVRRTRRGPGARSGLISRFAGITVGLLIATAALGDVTISVVDATPTARHDGTLPGIGEWLFSADVHVEVTPGDNWGAGGIGMVPGTIRPSVFFRYAGHDPNTGNTILTAPGYGDDAREFSTFMSFPREQAQRQRFTQPVTLTGAYWGAPFPIGDPTYLSVAYWQPPPPLGESGYTQRVTIDIEESIYAGRRVYPARIGAADPGHILLVEFESAALTWDGFIRDIRWGFFAVPEPSVLWLIAPAALFAIRRSRRTLRERGRGCAGPP